jgi:hypothetical protein
MSDTNIATLIIGFAFGLPVICLLWIICIKLAVDAWRDLRKGRNRD